MTDDNKFAPPMAQVADPEPQRLLPERPRQVRLAVALLWLSFVIGIPTWLLGAARNPEHGYEPVALVVTALLFAFSALLNLLIYKGANWARIVILVFALIGAVFLLLPLDEPHPPGLLEKALYVADLLLQVPALYLLFTAPGSLWFKRRT